MTGAFARLIVWARVPVIVGWLAVTVAATNLPTLEEAQTGALGQVVASDSRALAAEESAARLFAFPLASRTLVVERDATGLSDARLAATARRIAEANRSSLDVEHPPAGAYGIANVLPGVAFARERGTTAATALLYGPEFNQAERVTAAREYARALEAPAESFVGVTGAVPARAAQAEVIADRLLTIEVVTVLLVTITVAVYLRSLLAPVVTLLTVGVAYLVSVRAVAAGSERLGISVPPEVEPIIVALLFGVVTDYGLFYMSRFRRRLAEGGEPLEAARRTTAELTPVILACGLAVVGGSAALAVADLGFLRAFGPGMAVAVLIALAVTLTLLPALLSLAGRALFWPGRPTVSRGDDRRPGAMNRLIVTAVRKPKATIAVTLVLLAAPSAGLLWLEVGNPLIRGLPPDAGPRAAYDELSKGFAPGVVSPVSLIVEAPGLARRRDALAELQQVLAAQPGVAGVIGPASNPTAESLGIVLSRSGDAARFVLISEEDPLGAASVRRLDNLRDRVDGLLEAVGLPDADAAFAGDTAIVVEVIDTANDDLLRVTPVVLLAVAVVLALFLRAIVAPLYLVLLAALAPTAAVGLAVIVFQGVLGHAEITYFVPLAAGVLLISLGSDYNIFLVGRIWREARKRPLREAIVIAASGASHAISAAGLVLAGSFAALALVPLRSFQELAFVLAAGLLIDAFLVRSVLTPAVVALVGERSGWPGGRLRNDVLSDERTATTSSIPA